jgi:glutamate dehydrogenase
MGSVSSIDFSLLPPELSKEAGAFYTTIENRLSGDLNKFSANLSWLHKNMHPYFFITMKEDIEAIMRMAYLLHSVAHQNKIILSDTDDKLFIIRRDFPGSLYETMMALQEAEISYMETGHSYASIPESNCELEFQKFEFKCKEFREITLTLIDEIPLDIYQSALKAMKIHHPNFVIQEFDEIIGLLWINNENYIRISPPERIARILWLFQKCRQHEGLFINIEKTSVINGYQEFRLLFSIEDPPVRGLISQVSEIFQRLNIGVRRSYCLNIVSSTHTYFLGAFYIRSRPGETIDKESILYNFLKRELYNTQILPTANFIYKNFLVNHFMTGEEASLTNAFIAFAHTTLSHCHPDRFSIDIINNAFEADPAMVLKLITIFKKRFDPNVENQTAFTTSLLEIGEEIENYNTGQQHIDETRKTIFKTCLLFIKYTLKTNYFVPEKHAISFRLDPAYLKNLEPQFIDDLPNSIPFRITFFFSRYGVGYHIGFSDIARGGWRSIICRNRDEYTSNTNTLFREVFVLAHTQHLKNKDIYEGGSKMVIVIKAMDLQSDKAITQRLHMTQSCIADSFLDIFITDNGKVRNPCVVDYYGEDEPIELGPDENMHDSMIELIAQKAKARGYVLGIGIMSSKQIGINHKEYGVTSRGVIKFAEIAMSKIGIDILREPFTMRLTGGPNGDVAGNSIKLVLQRCPMAKILSIIDGTAGLFDPEGTNKKGLSDILLKEDLDHFDPDKLNTGGYIIYRNQTKKDGVRLLYRKVEKTHTGLAEDWITADEFNKEISHLTFSVKADLFLPCGGRPETVNENNWQKLFNADGSPLTRIIIEGANSFITPSARIAIQKKGVVVLRDASANKCGVISSSYEIIANLLMTECEFLTHKDSYVEDVLEILEQRSIDEVNLIFQRHREADGRLLYTDISDAISQEIIEHYEQFFDFFQNRPGLANNALFGKVILSHLPAIINGTPKYRSRIANLPQKIKCAILASEIALNIVYRDGWKNDLEHKLTSYVKHKFSTLHLY